MAQRDDVLGLAALEVVLSHSAHADRRDLTHSHLVVIRQRIADEDGYEIVHHGAAGRHDQAADRSQNRRERDSRNNGEW